MRNIYAIYLQYTDEHQDMGLDTFSNFLQKLFPHGRKEYLIVDNALTHNTEYRLQKNRYKISGNNSCREFSGYDLGIRWIKQVFAPADEDVFVMANDTFHRSYGKAYLDWFFPELIEMALEDGKIAGYVDGYPEAVELCGLRFQQWIRTSCFISSCGVLNKFLPLEIPIPHQELFSKDDQEFFNPLAPLSDNYKQFLRTWLFGENDPSGIFQEAWHQQSPLTPDNVKKFQVKTRCILSEHYFSARTQKFDVGILNVRRFESLMKRH